MIDAEKRRRSVLILAVNPTSGKGHATSRVEIDDGYFDVMVLGKVSRRELLKVFPKVSAGKHVNHPAVIFYRAKDVEINGSGPSFADGEPISTLPLKAHCVSGALRVWAR